MSSFKIQGNIVDIPAKNIFYGEISVEDGKIISITELPTTNRAMHNSKFCKFRWHQHGAFNMNVTVNKAGKDEVWGLCLGVCVWEFLD